MQCRVVVKLTSKGRQLRDLTGDVMNCVTAAVGMEEQCLSLMQQLQDLREHLKMPQPKTPHNSARRTSSPASPDRCRGRF
jgi:ribosomal protein S15P/S13E